MKLKTHIRVPTWSLYLIPKDESKARLIVKDAEEEPFLDKYFIGLEKNILKNPGITAEQLIAAYKKMWSSKGELRSFYTDSWGHKWVCFPKDDKLIKYLKHYVKA